MKVVILAGGRGSRLSEETRLVPKPMVEIGGVPMLLHVMRIYAGFGLKDFIIACGYKGHVIKEYFRNFATVNSDWTINLRDGNIRMASSQAPDWNVTLVDTGLDTQTGGRIKRLTGHLKDETFMVTYGDGVADIDINALIATHRRGKRLATVTAVRPPARFGSLAMEGDLVTDFSEKAQAHAGWINGGFQLFEPAVLGKISGDKAMLEMDLLEKLAEEGQLTAYRHEGFWHPMDTLRDKELLEGLWNHGDAPWVAKVKP
jgi:glucose-1-phosphate cytidylyltransferase